MVQIRLCMRSIIKLYTHNDKYWDCSSRSSPWAELLGPQLEMWFGTKSSEWRSLGPSGGRDWVQRSVGQSDPNLNRNCISLAQWSQHQQSCYSAMQIQQHYYRLIIDQSYALLLLLSDRLLESLCWWIRDIDPRPRLLSVRALLRITNTGR